MSTPTSIKDHQRWLVACQLANCLFYVIYFLFILFFGGRWHGLLGASFAIYGVIFGLPLLLGWLGYQSDQAWCHYGAALISGGALLMIFSGLDFLRVLLSPLIGIVLLWTFYLPVVPLLYFTVQHAKLGSALRQARSGGDHTPNSQDVTEGGYSRD